MHSDPIDKQEKNKEVEEEDNESDDVDSPDMPDNTPFDPVSFFTNKELCYYKMIDKFFKNCTQEQISLMLGIINGTAEISLRVLDWVVTKYSKRYIDFDIKSKTNGEIFDMHISYKSQLKSYKKRYFDPFRRRKKFHYNYDKSAQDKTVYTTLGQLNFFKWAISNDIIKYVQYNINNVIHFMNTSNKEDKKKKDKKKVVKEIKAPEVPTDTNTTNIDINADKDKDSINNSVTTVITTPGSQESSDTVSKSSSKAEKITKSKKLNIKATRVITDAELQLTVTFD